jgi:hypothetical protein
MTLAALVAGLPDGTLVPVSGSLDTAAGAPYLYDPHVPAIPCGAVVLAVGVDIGSDAASALVRDAAAARAAAVVFRLTGPPPVLAHPDVAVLGVTEGTDWARLRGLLAASAPVPAVAVDARGEEPPLTALLFGRGDVRAAATALGLPVDGTFAVVAFDAARRESARRLAELVGFSWDAYRSPVWSTVDGRTVYAVIGLTAPAALPRVRDVAVRAARDAEGVLRAPVRAGIGPAANGVADLPRARRIADDVLRAVLARPGGAAVDTLDGVRAEVVLRALRDAAESEPGLYAGAVAPLAAHDAANGTAYVATLRAYLDAFGDVADAAARICVHVKTFRYRLRRIAELSGIRLADPEERLAVHLELRLRDT